MTNSRILALDMATITGWALARDGSTHSGTINLKLRSGDSRGMRLLRFEDSLRDLAPGWDKEMRIVYEKPVQVPRRDTSFTFQLQGVLLSYCERHNIPCECITPAEIKKHATGKGNANKDAMLAAARAKWPDQDIKDDNQADALWLLDYTLTQIYPIKESL